VGQAGLPGDEPLDGPLPQKACVHRIAFLLIGEGMGITDDRRIRGMIVSWLS
jgi:hypothetical protein